MTLRYSERISKQRMEPQAFGRSWLGATFKKVKMWQMKGEKGSFMPSSAKKITIHVKEVRRPVRFTLAGGDEVALTED